MPDFDPDQYLQEKEKSTGGFDPDAYLAEKSGTTAAKPGDIAPIDWKHFDPNKLAQKDQADVLLQMGNTVTGGYAPQLYGAVQKLGGGDYTKGRDELINRLSGMDKYNKGVGTVLGLGASLPVGAAAAEGVGGLLPEAAGAFMKANPVKAAALEGATYGAAQNPGDTKGQINPLQLGERSKNALLGGAIGGGVGALGKLISKPALEQGALEATEMHARPTAGVKERLGKKGMDDVSKELLATESIPVGGKAADTLTNVTDRKDEVGQLIGDMVEQAPGTVDPNNIFKRVDDEIIAPLRESGTKGDNAIADLMEEEKQSLMKKWVKEGEPAQMTGKNIETVKRSFDKEINWNNKDAKAKNGAYQDLAGIFRDEGEKLISPTTPGFEPAKRSYGNLIKAEKMLRHTSALSEGGTGLIGQIKNAGYGLAALQTLLAGHPITALGVGAAGLARGRTASSIGRGLSGLSKLAPQTNKALVNTGIWNRILQGQNNK